MKNLITYIFILIPVFMQSQNLEDALRFSKTENFSTARSMGVAGSFGAMGADFGAISYNPASLGNYWKGEISVSLSNKKTNTLAELGGKSSSKDNNGLSFDNIGIVSNWKFVNNDKVTSKSFAIGLNSVASYSYNLNVEGNTHGSIFEDGNLVTGIDYTRYKDFDVTKNQSITEKGGQKELIIAYGQNHNNKFLWGISFGIPFLDYKTTRSYTEYASSALLNDPDFFFSKVDYNQIYSTTGVGFNLKAGAIIKMPSDIRVGLAVHTPITFRMKDDYEESMNVSEINGWDFTNFDDVGYFDYKFVTPWKFIGSIGKVFGNEKLGGFINLDGEFLNYSGAKFNFHAFSSDTIDIANEKYVNTQINTRLKSTINLRLGGELAFHKLRLRGGIGMYDNAFTSSQNYDPSYVKSLGIGYRGNSMYFDVAFLTSQQSYAYYPYTADEIDRSPQVNVDKTINKITATLGLKF